MQDITIFIKDKKKFIDGVKKGFIVLPGLLKQVFRFLAFGYITSGGKDQVAGRFGTTFNKMLDAVLCPVAVNKIENLTLPGKGGYCIEGWLQIIGMDEI